MRIVDNKIFANAFKVKPDKSISFLLGAGASVASRIPSGKRMTWEFKRAIYCMNNNLRTSTYDDLSSDDVQKEIQAYFDNQRGYPPKGSPEEYSFYFDKCFPFKRDRTYYIQNKVRDANPSLGYLCLGEMIINGKVNLIATTNFDDLVQVGVHSINPGFSIKTILSATSYKEGIILNEGFPNVIKLHGDYLYDTLKNTSEELQELECSIANTWKTAIYEDGLVIIGYAGNDNSVMSILEKLIEEGGIKKGIYWCKYKNEELSVRANKFMTEACNINEQSSVIEINEFDEFMYSLYLALNLKNFNIDKMWEKNYDER